jgi:hypothetical protein
MENEMNKTNLLVASAIVALVAATGYSVAQQERGLQQERGAPAEKIAPQNAPGVRNPGANNRGGEAIQNRGRGETTGQAPQSDRQSRPNEHNSQQERRRAEQPLRSERNGQNRTTGQAPREDRLDRGEEQNRTTGQAPREVQKNIGQERERIHRTEENRETTGQGAAGARGNFNLTPEKRTRIHEVIVNERSAPRVANPSFNVSVGTRVPRTMRFVALPRTIVEIEPAWRGFEYFMIGDQIIVVDPRSMEIVAIVDA